MVLSHKFLILLYIIILVRFNESSLEENKINYLEFPFKTNFTINDTSDPNIIAKNLFYNQIYINISVGSSKQEIPFYLHTQQYPCVIQSAIVDASQVKGFFNESLSDTYKVIKGYNTFSHGDMYKSILALDEFYINNNACNFTFYLSKENKVKTHITEGGKMGFQPTQTKGESKESFFITNLKQNNLTSSSVFLLKYNSNNDDDSGKFIIGAYPHLYDNAHYKEEYYINDNAEKDFFALFWIFKFDEIKIGEEIIEKNNKNIYFYYDLGFIIGTTKYFKYLKSQESFNYYFENTTKCHKSKFTINDLEMQEMNQNLRGDFVAYYCDKDFDVRNINISNTSFVRKSMKYSFYFDENDFWMEKGNYKYFIFLEKLYNDNWCLGKPFFKKYEIVFDFDNLQIGLYTKIINDNESSKDESGNKNIFSIASISVIVGLIIIIGFLIFWLIKCYINSPRKKRANELIDDNYEYNNGVKGSEAIIND